MTLRTTAALLMMMTVKRHSSSHLRQTWSTLLPFQIPPPRHHCTRSIVDEMQEKVRVIPGVGRFPTLKFFFFTRKKIKLGSNGSQNPPTPIPRGSGARFGCVLTLELDVR
jgi:hypothetical protein